ncbi:MAG TPA: NUDIX domain-containing protein, partial [Candidatus Saccharimonadales bacterium]|nr:NUDIX domain-containing protein [Candidatus Saccharimonadales bacterium]
HGSVSPLRPDLVDAWLFRVIDGRPEVLLLRRSPGRVFEGLWQGVSGALEPGEAVVLGALREVDEETGFGPDVIEAFYHLDQVNQFHVAEIDAIVMSAVFALRIRPDAALRLSYEHDEARWLTLDEAFSLVVWPAYRESIERIRDCLLDSERAPWFELTLDGRRRRR